MMYSFVIAGIVCALTALMYSEIAAMVPVSGSAYTYSTPCSANDRMDGRLGADPRIRGRRRRGRGRLVGLRQRLPRAPRDRIAAGTDRQAIRHGDDARRQHTSTATGSFNLIAFLLSLLITVLLVWGTSKSAKFTAALVIVKIVALSAFIALVFPAVDHANFSPMLPNGWGTPLSGVGVLGAAASIFFAYVGFDAVPPRPRKPGTRTATSRSA